MTIIGEDLTKIWWEIDNKLLTNKTEKSIDAIEGVRYWKRIFEIVILNRWFWKGWFEKVVMKRWFWKEYYEEDIMKRLFCKECFEKAVLKRFYWIMMSLLRDLPISMHICAFKLLMMSLLRDTPIPTFTCSWGVWICV